MFAANCPRNYLRYISKTDCGQNVEQAIKLCRLFYEGLEEGVLEIRDIVCCFRGWRTFFAPWAGVGGQISLMDLADCGFFIVIALIVIAKSLSEVAMVIVYSFAEK